MRKPITLRLGILLVAFFVAVGFGQRAQSPPDLSTGDTGPATKAPLYDPTGLAVNGEYLYIVESGAKRLRRVDLESGIITTIAGGGKPCSERQNEFDAPGSGCFDYPQRVAVDSFGNAYVTDEGLEGVAKIAARTHSFSMVTAGTVRVMSAHGSEKTAKLEWPAGIAVSSPGSLLFDDHTEHTVYRMTFGKSALDIVAGTGIEGYNGDGGPAEQGELRFPDGLAIDAEGNLFIADYGNCRIQKVDSKTGVITTVTGTEKGGRTCEQLSDYGTTLDNPSDVAVNQRGDVYFVLPYRLRVQRFDPKTGRISTVAGSGKEGFTGDGGVATEATLHFPEGIALDKAGNLFISDSYNGRVRRVDARTGIITTVAGNGPIQVNVIL